MPQATPSQRKATPPTVSLRLNCPLALYEKISAYRHEARHESRSQAMITLVAAGLAALAKPPNLPPPDRPKQLVAFAGSEHDGRRRGPTTW